MKASPLPYQEQSIEQIEQFRGRCLLANEMGLGKTLTCLWWWERHPEAHPGLVVCPASAKPVWEHEAMSNLGIRPYIIEGVTPRPSVFRRLHPELVVVNYDVLHRWQPWLKRYGFRSLFVDECQNIKNSGPGSTRNKNRQFSGSIRGNAVRMIAKGIKHVIAVSGTPLMNRPIELFPTLQMIRPGIFPSRIAYAHEFCKPRWTPWGWMYDGASRIPELHDLLKQTCMIRHLKKDVLPDLPEKTRRVLPLPLSDEAEYQEASESFLSWMSRTNPARLFSAEKAEALVRLGELKRLTAKLKLRAVVSWTNEWLESFPDEKLVLFAIHRKMIEALVRRVRAESVVIDGSVSGRGRKLAIDRFQWDGSTRVCVGNVRAAGTAITLTAASTAAFVELDWVPTVMIQAEDRIYRIGQTRPSWIWWLVAAGTIEDDLCEILERKQWMVSNVLDGSDAPDLDIYRQLLERLASKTGKKK